MIDLLDAIKAALEADPTVSAWCELVSVASHDRTRLPEFETFAIVVSPASSLRFSERLAVREKQHTVQADIVLLRWRWNKADSEALYATGAAPGILRMIEDVWDVLNDNSFDGQAEVLGDEVLAGITMQRINNDAYYEAVIPVKLRLLSFTE